MLILHERSGSRSVSDLSFICSLMDVWIAVELPYVQGTSPETTSQEMRAVRLLCKNVHLNRKECSTGYITSCFTISTGYITSCFTISTGCITSYVTGVWRHMSLVYNVSCHCTTVLFIVPSAMLLYIYSSHNELFTLFFFLYTVIVVSCLYVYMYAWSYTYVLNWSRESCWQFLL